MGDITAEKLTRWSEDRFAKEADIPEKKVQQADLSGLLNVGADPAEVQVQELEGGLDGCGIMLHNILSRQECMDIIKCTEEAGYGWLGRGGTGMAYRGNHRCQIQDADGCLGKELWRRIQGYLPVVEKVPDEPGAFTFSHVNNWYRFAKYYTGQGFAPHKDKPTIYEQEQSSLFTVNIYLNDLTPGQAGKTRFFTSMLSANRREPPTATAGGAAGSVLIFKQSQFPCSPVHDGDQLKSGLKYLMRTDLVYKAVHTPAL